MANTEYDEYENLRQAAIRMQVAVGHVFSTGGLDVDKWWPELILAQQNLSRHTSGTIEEFNTYRKWEIV